MNKALSILSAIVSFPLALVVVNLMIEAQLPGFALLRDTGSVIFFILFLMIQFGSASYIAKCVYTAVRK